MTTNEFQIEEATIDQVHNAFKSGALTAQALVSAYIDRIDKIDKSGPWYQFGHCRSIRRPWTPQRRSTISLQKPESSAARFMASRSPSRIRSKPRTFRRPSGRPRSSATCPQEDATAIKKAKAAGAHYSGEDSDARLRDLLVRVLLGDR